MGRYLFGNDKSLQFDFLHRKCCTSSMYMYTCMYVCTVLYVCVCTHLRTDYLYIGIIFIGVKGKSPQALCPKKHCDEILYK